MNTVQQYLKDIDVDKLIDVYMFEYPVDLMYLRDIKETLDEVNRRIVFKLKEYIEKMSNIEIEHSETEWVFFVNKEYGEFGLENQYSLAKLEDIRGSNTKVERYSCLLIKQEIVMGYFIANTELTQFYIYDILAYILHEMSFFGFEQEEREEVVLQLEQGMIDVELGKTETYSMEEVFEKIGCRFLKEDQDVVRNELLHTVAEDIVKLNDYCIETEINKIRKSL